MFFKLTYVVKSLDLGENDKIGFLINENENQVNVELTKISKELIKNELRPEDAICSATTQRKITEKKKIQFESMDAEVPPAIRQFIDEVIDELYDNILHVVRNFRWKRGIATPHNFLRFGGGLKWSFDNNIWMTIPSQLRLNVTFGFPINQKINQTELDNLQDLLSNKIYAPLGHELFCEAWDLKDFSIRSSLVLGIASAETGFKEFVGKLIPHVGWLIENTQSPPLISMLETFLIKLPVKNKIRGKTVPPTKAILESLKKGIKIRNEIVHGRNTVIKRDTVEEVLGAVRDLLYLLDFYCGINWALDNISVETKKALINEAEKIK